MNKRKSLLIKRRIKIFVFAHFLFLVCIYNAIMSYKTFELNQNVLFIMTSVFYFSVTAILGYNIIKYKGHLYDRYFRKKKKHKTV